MPLCPGISNLLRLCRPSQTLASSSLPSLFGLCREDDPWTARCSVLVRSHHEMVSYQSTNQALTLLHPDLAVHVPVMPAILEQKQSPLSVHCECTSLSCRWVDVIAVTACVVQIHRAGNRRLMITSGNSGAASIPD